MPQSQHLKLVSSAPHHVAISLENFGVWFGDSCILSGVNAHLPKRGVTVLVGPSGAGKSTLLRALNRISDDMAGLSIQGRAYFEGCEIYAKDCDVTKLRARIGMVFQKPCVFPRSIAQNVLFGLRGVKLSQAQKHDIVEQALRGAALWNDVHARLGERADTLSMGQQQRLCIARALALKPDVLLMDEPTASVDPVSARTIEALMRDLGRTIPVLTVTHNLAQAKRIADHVLFLCEGQLVEAGDAAHMFSNAALPKTQTYLCDEFCEC
ncbi:phosphate ABC transporter ATP-binding protein [Robiginitomaculum antarcticum]|uniref:phosphate ABC transporter ATP-binding protein n=1 Tax=Robiginitomaculum antarcticum TaxID=437507 RepID=UPI0003766809|nr:ATP-binding cassette domain-containing protein [Robiginitomaculum antarcticum]